jgi:AAA domain
MAPAVPAAKQPPGTATQSPAPTPAQRAALAAAAAVARATRAQQPTTTAPANTTQAILPGKASGRMALGKVIKGRIAKPMRLLVYGIEGVGKSTFAAAAPAPIFLGAEDGTSELDVERFPQPQTWQDALEAVAELTTAPHDYQTLVIDTLDWLEPLCWTHVCRESRDDNGRPFQSIEDFGYGKGYVAAHDQWRRLASDLETLRTKRHMHIILLAHSAIRTFRNPAGDDFDRYELKLHKAPSGYWREWSDAVLFASHDLNTVKKAGRVRGIMGNQRVLHTERTAAWDAKNRYDLPPRLALDWQEFADAASAHRPADRRTLLAMIEAQLGALADDAKRVDRARAALAKAVADNDDAEIARIANKLAAIIAAADTSQDQEAQP